MEWFQGTRAAGLREHMNVQDLQLLEVLDFDPRAGLITFRDQRMLIQGAGAMGLLRKELIETLGAATTRRLLLRFGYADGYHMSGFASACLGSTPCTTGVVAPRLPLSLE